LPPTPGFSTFSVEPTICSSDTVTCSGPNSCYGQPNGQNLTLHCGDLLPCTANACSISILCPTLTDLSYLLSANGVTFYMHHAPCKLPFSMNASTIILF
jgi:hypothetical protein